MNPIHDVRLALRSFRRHRLIAVLAVFSLALAIAGNATVFSLFIPLLYRPLPFPEPDRLVTVVADDASAALILSPDSMGNYLDLKERSSTIELGAYSPLSLAYEVGDDVQSLPSVAVSTDLLPMLGASPILGRTFLPEEELPGRGSVVLASHAFFEGSLGSDPAAVGRSVTLDGNEVEVIGVLPPDFELLSPQFQLFVPLEVDRANLPPRDSNTVQLLGRLVDRVSIEAADAEISKIAAELVTEHPENRNYAVQVKLFSDLLVNDLNRQLGLLMQTGLLFVLMIACVNVANLLLARGRDRERELALRAALGSGRRRIVHQLLLESVVLAVVGGGLGIGLAAIAIRVIRQSFAGLLPSFLIPELDGPLVVFTIVLSLGSGILFGLLPAWRASRPDLVSSLREGGRGATAGRRLLSKGLVAAQITLALIMLSGSVLMVRAFRDLQTAAPGFDQSNLLTFNVSLPENRYTEPASASAFYDTLLDRVEATPGVASAAASIQPPRSPFNPSRTFEVVGRETAEDDKLPATTWLTVRGDYLETLGVPLLRGRTFETADTRDAPRVALVNQAFVARHFPEGEVLGARLRLLEEEWTVVGVTANVMQELFALGGDRFNPVVYLPHEQQGGRQQSILVRTQVAPHDLDASLRATVRELDPKLSTIQPQTFDEFINQFFAGVGVMNTLLGVFGGLALVLAAVGIYGVIAYSVAQRTHEIGIRLALGARRKQVLRMVAWEGAKMILLGLVVAVPGILLAIRTATNALAVLTSVSPAAIVPMACVLVVVAGLATLVPAFRATRVNPIIALRTD